MGDRRMTAPPATTRRAIPQHLMQPKVLGTPKGTLTFDAANREFELTAHPAVLQLAKRVFPGSAHYAGARNLRFSATPRSAEDLNWLMLRYPITVQCPRQFAKVRRQALALHAARTQLAALPPVTTPPTFAGELSELQATDVARAIAMQKTLVRWPTGTGKTVMALATIASTNALPALIVVQAPLCRQWELMTQRFLRMPGEVVHVIRGLSPYPLPSTPVHIIHYGLLHGWMEALAAHGYRSVHFDEAQELRRTGSMKYSAASLVAADAEYVMGWTATPIYNYGGEIWSVLNAINELCLGTMESFSREWCDGFRLCVKECGNSVR
ncbi:MAG: hypothetical protein H3C62_00720 [Gemmatimonadaceae bacterium]|nr:hypothetical protein [Gemmatimonadaceae bacterium]